MLRVVVLVEIVPDEDVFGMEVVVEKLRVVVAVLRVVEELEDIGRVNARVVVLVESVLAGGVSDLELVV